MSSRTSEEHENHDANCEGSNGYTPFDEIPYSTAQFSSATYQQHPDDTPPGDGSNGDINEGGEMFTFGKSSKVEDGYHYSFCNGDDEDDYDETQPHEEVFYANANDHADEREEDAMDMDNDRAHDNDDGNNSIDFNALAAQALQSLDLEYNQTVQFNPNPEKKDVVHTSIATEHASLKKDNLETSTETHGTCTNETSEKLPTVSTGSTCTRTTATTKIDTKAISTAIENITLKAPNLDLKFQNWKEQHQQKELQKYQHSLIHHKPLMAFHRQSDKAKSAAANLSRSATLAESIHRLFLNVDDSNVNTNTIDNDHINFAATANITKYRERYHYKDEVFVIHCVGADRVECQTRDTITTAFGPIIKWIHQYHHFENGLGETNVNEDANANADSFLWPKHLRIELLGPNVPPHSERFGSMNLLPAAPGRLDSATVVCKNCMYHDYLEELEELAGEEELKESDYSKSMPVRDGLNARSCVESMQFPNLVISYNSGIWGYSVSKYCQFYSQTKSDNY